MMSKRRGSILLTLGMLLPFVAQSGRLMADTAAVTAPTISGYVDTQYGYNFANPANGSNNTIHNGISSPRSYDAQDNTISNTAYLSMTGKIGDALSYAINLGAGHEPETTVGAVGPSAVALQEAYATYVCPVTHLGFKVGKFATYEGIEVYQTNANPTISRGYLYGLAEPFTHVGGVLTYVAGPLDFAAGVVNGWDLPDDNNPGKTWVGKVGLSLGDKLAATLSGYSGPEQAQTVVNGIVNGNSGKLRKSVDLTMLTKIIPKVDLNIQFNAGTESDTSVVNANDRGSWSGAALEPVVHVTDKLSLGARLEYFADKDGARTGIANNDLTNLTITPGYQINSNLLVRAEYRYDTTSKKTTDATVFEDDKGMPKDSSSTAAVQVVVSF